MELEVQGINGTLVRRSARSFSSDSGRAAPLPNFVTANREHEESSVTSCERGAMSRTIFKDPGDDVERARLREASGEGKEGMRRHHTLNIMLLIGLNKIPHP